MPLVELAILSKFGTHGDPFFHCCTCSIIAPSAVMTSLSLPYPIPTSCILPTSLPPFYSTQLSHATEEFPPQKLDTMTSAPQSPSRASTPSEPNPKTKNHQEPLLSSSSNITPKTINGLFHPLSPTLSPLLSLPYSLSPTLSPLLSLPYSLSPTLSSLSPSVHSCFSRPFSRTVTNPPIDLTATHTATQPTHEASCSRLRRYALLSIEAAERDQDRRGKMRLS
jgi:hypothetical protein